MLCLKHLLLSRAQVLQSMGMRISSRRHGGHQSGIHLPSRPDGHVCSYEMLRYRTTRGNCSRIGRYRSAHGMTSGDGMSHPSRVPSEVGAHARRHHTPPQAYVRSV